jgi:mannose-6-phosphate isomerase-like protein (cupin superfamily)
MNKLREALKGFTVVVIVAWTAGLMRAQQASPPNVEYYPHAQVAAAFAKGVTLTEGESGGGAYKVLTARRDGPGEVEVHGLDTDIVYVLKGTATFVTGGTVVGGRQTAPNETRGQRTRGGTLHHLGPEDIIVIPHGVPHWFEAVQPPFLYLVIKVH